MAAEKQFKVHGINVKMWKTSFKVDGMATCVFVGNHMTEIMVRQMVSAVYNSVHAMAVRRARRDVADKVYDLLEGAGS